MPCGTKIRKRGISKNPKKETIIKKYGQYYFKESHITFSQKHKKTLETTLRQISTKNIQPHMSKNVTTINTNDGLKITFQNQNWALLRFSGTEPLLRIYVESDTALNSDTLENETKTFIKHILHHL